MKTRLMLAVVVLVPTVATAYVRTRTSSATPVLWNGACAAMQMSRVTNPDLDDERLRTAFETVVATWEDRLAGCAPLGISLSSELSDKVDIGYDGTNLLRWRLPGACEDPAQADSELCRTPNAAAVTTVFFVDRPGDARDGELLEVDLELNAINFQFADNGDRNRMDLQNTLSHELGHVMGLDHTCFTLRGGAPPLDSNHDQIPYCFPLGALPPVVTESTMFNFAEPGETKKRGPSPDETRAVCELYANRPATCTDREMPGCGCELGDSGATSLVAGLATFLASLVLFPRRRSKP